MQNYFEVTPPSVRQMILTLHANGFIDRIPGQARAILLLIPKEALPQLD
jgi:Mn-dependent DtxR family transcriptional regulator